MSPERQSQLVSVLCTGKNSHLFGPDGALYDIQISPEQWLYSPEEERSHQFLYHTRFHASWRHLHRNYQGEDVVIKLLSEDAANYSEAPLEAIRRVMSHFLPSLSHHDGKTVAVSITYGLPGAQSRLPTSPLQQELQAMKEALRSKDRELLNKERELLNKDCELLNKERKLLNKDRELLNKERELLNKDCKLLDKDRELLNQDCELLNKDREIRGLGPKSRF
ncbi:hypothetical protein OQA88_13198 [Cercophora sp. LCS_1]